MPDISMCSNFACPKRDHCYRYRAFPSGRRQAYAAFTLQNGECLHFIHVDEYNRVRDVAVVDDEWTKPWRLLKAKRGDRVREIATGYEGKVLKLLTPPKGASGPIYVQVCFPNAPVGRRICALSLRQLLLLEEDRDE